MQTSHRNEAERRRGARGSLRGWSAALALAGLTVACEQSDAGPEAAAAVGSAAAGDGGSVHEAGSAGDGGSAARSGDATAASTARGEGLSGPPTGLVPPAPGQEHLVGVVAQHLPAGGYTYLQVELAQGEPRWVVTMRRDVGTGDRVRVDNLGSRHDFYSRRLDRRFAELVFGVVEVVG
jgi:hypothetical protein